MNFYDAMKQIKNKNLAPIYLIMGLQTYLMEQLKRQLINIIPAKDRVMNFASYDMETNSLTDAINDALSAPFFAAHRLVLINNPMFLTGEKGRLTHNLDDLLDYIQKPLASTVLVLMAPYEKLDARKKLVKQLKQHATFIDLQAFNEAETRHYVERFLNQQGYQIQTTVMDQLLQRTDGQLSIIMNDLPKLMIYGHHSHQITSAAVKNLVTKTLNQNIFDLVDLVLKRQTTAAVKLYQNLLMSGKASLQINAALLSQFRLLLQVIILKDYGYSQGKLASTLKVHPYRVKLALQTIRHYQFIDLRRAFLGLAEIEKRLKSTDEAPELLFEMFMLRFA